MGVDEVECRNTILQPGDLKSTIALFLGKEPVAVGHDEAKVPRTCLINAWIVDFVQDPVAESEPHPAHMGQRRAHAALCAGGPARCDAWPAWCVGHSRLLKPPQCRFRA